MVLLCITALYAIKAELKSDPGTKLCICGQSNPLYFRGKAYREKCSHVTVDGVVMKFAIKLSTYGYFLKMQ